ncbi:MAG TPA: AAA family ATPase, partial [Caldilineaceae bacterium]|nr:AAA family ATPase [Caldilineaceae bacterium]
MSTDPRLQTFCSHQGLDVFHSITHQNQIWKPDPYDIETIHAAGRAAYERLLNRIDSNTVSDSGRILLLLGESGAGKTHLMRAFRNQTHEQQKGFFSYMQMTSAVSNYARYVLRNTIDSFDKPYYEPFGTTTGLIKLSNALAEDATAVSANELTRLRESELSPDALVDLIYPIADRIVALERFQGIDIDLIRALLYLQPGQPAINAKIFKLIRCEPLTTYDSKVLGGMAARAQEDDPLRMLQSLARLIQAVTDGAFVICLDQLEDIHGMDEAATRFRRAVQTIVTLAEIPNVVVVLSCLEIFYDILKENLPKSHLDRLEMDPLPVTLKAQRIEEEIQQILARRLQYLFELTDTPFADDSSIFPFPPATIQTLANRTTRDVLEWCRRKREESIATGNEPTLYGGDDPDTKDISKLSQFWSDHLTKNVDLPEADQEFLALIGQSIERCAQELGNGYHFATQVSGDYLSTTVQAAPEAITETLLLGMCQKSA